MDAYKKRDEREIKGLKLQARKNKLKQLLDTERDSYEAELKGLSPGNYQRLKGMRDRTDDLKTRKESPIRKKNKQVSTNIVNELQHVLWHSFNSACCEKHLGKSEKIPENNNSTKKQEPRKHTDQYSGQF